MGAHVQRKVPEKKCRTKFVVPLNVFGFTSTISRFGERFRDGQYSLVSFLFAVLLLKLFTHIVQRLWCYNLMALYKSV